MNGPATHGLDFARCFAALTGHAPLRWQKRLFDAFAQGKVPTTVDLPTGLGKTSVIPIWLSALVGQGGPHSDGANDAAKVGERGLPRRLVYIVNRRTVVDQATDVVERMRLRLQDPCGEQWNQHQATLDDLAHRLRALSASDEEGIPFGVSTLRGELADNEEWKTDPARPAIIVGTIDMIGSKLLFSGYGDGRYGRAHHAGLIGQDTLIVHDEAHLTPAFSELLRSIAEEQDRSGEPRRVRVMELSATQRGSDEDAFQLRLEDEADERTGQIVKDRLDAKKHLHLHKHDDLVTGLVDIAKAHVESPAKVLVYVRSPEDAQELAAQIRKELNNHGGTADERVALLTGTIRGYERDKLLGHPVMKCMFGQACPLESHYLVSTSAGEVGIDIDADHMVCDLTALDSMIQRLGRVNRRGGEGRVARVDVVWTEKDAKPGDKASSMQRATASTLKILQRWFSPEFVARQCGEESCTIEYRPSGSADGLLVSPRNLRGLIEGLCGREREEALSPKGETAPLTDILLDNWSLTSVDAMPGRPEVAAYLHGLTTDPPETYVAWRKEVAALAGAGADESTLSDWFRACRVEARERLRDRTDHVRKAFEALLKTHRGREPKDPERDFPVVLLDERGRVEWSILSAIVRRPESNARDVLHYRTVILPVEAGGLDEHGMLDGKDTEPVAHIDIAEVAAEIGWRERWLHLWTAGGEPEWRRLLSGEQAEPPSELRERERVPLKEPQEGAEDKGESIYLVLLESPGAAAIENPEAARVQQTLAEHTEAIVKHMEAIADRLGLKQAIKDALVSAARWHDRGKDRAVWQRFARNDNVAVPLAKSTRYLHGRALGGYRHEFGSVLEAMADEDIRRHPERDLILHLIAAHHGWVRPHFEPRAFDHEGPRDGANGERRAPTSDENEAAAVEAMQRFGRLQQRFGRWGLAWLESLLRCADALASQPCDPSPDGEAVAAHAGNGSAAGGRDGGAA